MVGLFQQKLPSKKLAQFLDVANDIVYDGLGQFILPTLQQNAIERADESDTGIMATQKNEGTFSSAGRIEPHYQELHDKRHRT